MKYLNSKKVISLFVVMSIMVGLFSEIKNVSAKEQYFTIETNNEWVNGSVNKEIGYYSFILPEDGKVTLGIRSYSLGASFQIIELGEDKGINDNNYRTVPVCCSGATNKPVEREFVYNLTAGKYVVAVGKYSSNGSDTVEKLVGKYSIKLKYEKYDYSQDKITENEYIPMKENSNVSNVFSTEGERSDRYCFEINKAKELTIEWDTDLSSWIVSIRNKKTDELIIWNSSSNYGNRWYAELKKGEYILTLYSECKGKYNLCLVSASNNATMHLSSKKIKMKPGQTKNVADFITIQREDCYYSNGAPEYERVLGDSNICAEINDFGEIKAECYGCDWFKVWYGNEEQKFLVLIMPPKVKLTAKKHVYTYPNGYKDKRITCSIKTKLKPRSQWNHVEFQYAYSTSPKFKKGKTKYTDNSDNVLMKINMKKKYYVKVRPYAIDYSSKKGKRRYYGEWSNVIVLK